MQPPENETAAPTGIGNGGNEEFIKDGNNSELADFLQLLRLHRRFPGLSWPAARALAEHCYGRAAS